MLRPASAVLLWLGGVSSALLGGTGARPLAPSAITELTNKGYTVCSNFLSTQEVSALSADISLLRTQSRFSVAGVGEQGSTARVDTGVRVCEQCFLYPRLPSNAGDPNAREDLSARIGGVLAPLDDEVGTKVFFSLTRPISPICQSPLFPYPTFNFSFFSWSRCSPKGCTRTTRTAASTSATSMRPRGRSRPGSGRGAI